MAFGLKEVGKSNGSEDSGYEGTIDRVIHAIDCPREIVEQIRHAKTTAELNSLGHTYVESHPTAAYSIFMHTRNKQGAYALLKSGQPDLAVEIFRLIGDNEGFEKAMAKIEETDPKRARYLRDHYVHVEEGQIKGAPHVTRHNGKGEKRTAGHRIDGLQGKLTE